jgi:DNA transformation protein and related proteins
MPNRISRSGPRRRKGERILLPAKRRDSVQEFLEERLGKLPELEIRPMFGGAGIYAEGTMFGIVHRGRVYLKTDESTRAAFVERGMKAFRPPRGAVLKSYYEIPPEILDDETECLSWARRAVAIAAAPSRSTKARTVAPAQILEGYSPKIRDVAERLRKIVLEEAPEAEEAGYVGWRLIGYRSPHYFCFVAPQADHVRLGFEHGVRLRDPDGVLESMGKQVRFVRCVPGRALPVAAMRSLIRAALSLASPSGRARPRG